MKRTARLNLPLAALLALHILFAHHAAAQSSKPAGEGTTMRGYKFETDVSQHARIDLDQWEMENTTDAAQWSPATSIYKNGKNSMKKQVRRTLAGFSTEADSKMAKEGYFRLYKAYWGSGTYADDFVTSGLDGSGRITGKPPKFRAEIANKGSQYQNVWMYVIHEMEDAIDDCKRNAPRDNDDPAVEAWDEAWAFYTGSLLAGNSSAGDGKLLYTLAHLRCNNFGTCDATNPASVIAPVNEEVVKLFNQGQSQMNRRSCDDAVETKNKIVRLMTVPLMQGTIRYVYAAKTDPVEGDERAKSHAEGWAFSAAMLPLVNYCDRSVADMLRKNFLPENEPMTDDPADVVRKLSSVYRCLGFSCEDVGKLNREDYPDCTLSGPQLKVIPGTNRAALDNEESEFKSLPSGPDAGGSGLSGGAIAGIVIGVLVAAAVVAALFFYRKSKSAKAIPMPPADDAGGDTFA